ncbi:phage terminase large subunit-like protein [Stella humosa]|uniref:Phage terminase large subunit-like protein n=2 Tax=Stella humosa TaxID=94 RepID=A0A3N1L0X8_9PROT|nr:terminase TerL endonuclease subunit [Stella humosa]ROP84258.1 phage terminase large subunit-like protein [Stella humosa]BBK33771.1 terminase [Stella humosa]
MTVAGCLTGSRFLAGPIADPMGKGERAVRFVEKLRHTEGPLAGRPFKLHDWQARIVRKVFGDVTEAGHRKIRTVFLLLPRGSGKTSLTSALALLCLLGPERDAAGQVIAAAADREQASIAYNASARAIRADADLSKATRIVDSRRMIVHPRSESTYRAISHEAYSKHGLAVSTLLADEIHAWPTRDLWDVLVSSMGKRLCPLTIVTTTAGAGRGTLAWDLYDYALKVERGQVEDETFLPVLYQAPHDADWRDEAIWQAVNPALAAGFRSLDEMRVMARQAAEIPSVREMFRRLYLNIWGDAATVSWVDMAIYDESAKAPVERADLAGRSVYVGVDLASVSDLAAVYAVAQDDDDGWLVWGRQYVPADTYRKRIAENAPYAAFKESGRLVVTDGAVIDQERIIADLVELCSDLDVREIAVDRWGATGFLTRLQERGLPVVQFGQGFASMSAPCKEIERAVIGRKLKAGGDPVLRWNIANIRVEPDAAGNIKFAKHKALGKIDGAVAVAMGIGRALANEAGPSVYETGRPEGVLFV